MSKTVDLIVNINGETRGNWNKMYFHTNDVL